MVNNNSNVRRGLGLLEPFYTQKRARMANRLIPQSLRHGRVLETVWGSYPYFLSHKSFKQESTIGQLPHNEAYTGTPLQTLNLNEKPNLPLNDAFLHVITVLAWVEHLDPTRLVALLERAYRNLRPGGKVIITTPAAWSDGILHWMSRFGRVSSDELERIQLAYRRIEFWKGWLCNGQYSLWLFRSRAEHLSVC